ncbi:MULTISPECIES: hypothetical protein [unclassified Streptomyces]|uniref:hypothetical protein n=1 Tax=unclassified Streptomyces TaxID=2593676 RepID=UPI00087F5602|nr:MULTISPECIES: hypothetical protein [unclassified Streptomyces]PBC84114.1 hypothetical protein BX261_4089 [Streptomyces sp. 2321.6]SDR34860.1 hypothetical protein SAMN05216511_3109 [Streptomyces sp. KS_16]SED20277.1 hypothetical protein SAMN05428940_4117 [Streptomyces sp. 2133.1]SNC70195.1 hypothetical protein SAMN06272741_4080 [Streptomyces sp. 2114.4]
MPRGRHRQSPPLHRLLPPATVAGASIACAAGAWFTGDDLVQRVLAAGAAAAALTGAVLLRTWDRAAGRRVAELDRARVRDEWRTEERIAELETDLEESRERRAAMEAKLRAKRAELARLRSEHAALLRRYATAETERASALEGRRLLAIEAAAPAKALPAAAALPRALDFVRAGKSSTASVPVRRDPTANGDGQAPAASPARATATFAQADRALRQLARNAARQRTAQKAARLARDGAGSGAEGTTPSGPPAARDAGEGQDGENGRGNPSAATAQRTGDAPARTAAASGPALRPVPATATALAPPRPATSRAQGGFDFFGNATAAGSRELNRPLEDDLADVVGDEALAEQSARARARTARAARTDARPQPSTADDAADGEHSRDGNAREGQPRDEQQADGERPDERTDGATTAGTGEVIDLTAHDETEQFEFGALRSAIS